MARQMRWWFGWLVMMGAASAAYAGNDASLAQEDRILQLERTVETLADELQRTRADMAVPEDGTLESAWGLGPAASKVYSVARGLSIGGYGEAFYSGIVGVANGAQNRADALRTVLHTGYKFSDSILFNSEIEFEHGSTGANGSVSVEFAALDFLWKDWANFRAGLVLIPMGWINEVHEPPSYFGTHRPEVERQIIPSTWREIGAGAFGTFAENFDFAVYVVNGMDAEGFSAGGLRGGRQNGSEALAEHLAFVGRLDWAPLPGFIVGGSVYHGNSGQNQSFTVDPGDMMPTFDVNLPDTPTTIWEAHAQYANHGWFLRGLVTMAFVGNAGALSRALAPVDEGGIGELSSGEGIGGQMLGAYGEVAYDILPWLCGEPGEQSLMPFFRAEYYDTQRDMPSGFSKDESKEIIILTAGVSYKPLPNVVIKADYRNRRSMDGSLPDELNLGVGFAF